jgi:RimJ/RimL family protein N-acetyltransferase
LLEPLFPLFPVSRHGIVGPDRAPAVFRPVRRLRTATDTAIKTARLLLRPFGPADAAAIARIGNERAKASFLPDWAMTEADAAELARFFGKCMECAGPVVWAVTLRETGGLIGHAGVGSKEELGGEVELWYAISEGHAGRGYATEAAKAAIMNVPEGYSPFI